MNNLHLFLAKKSAVSKSTTVDTRAKPARLEVADKVMWSKVATFISLLALLFYLWILVHYDEEVGAWTRKEEAWRGPREEEEKVQEVYVVYACTLLLLAGICIVWK
jgi:hypothetical protein